MAEAALIGVDWGTTSFRAFRLDASGAILDRKQGDVGIMGVGPGGFSGIFREQIGPWLAATPVPVLLSGMVGSRQGWVEAPYVACPAGLGDIAAGLIAIPGLEADVRIVPGVSLTGASSTGDSMADVIRGEETQAIGALARPDADLNGRMVLPGTHSKWVRLETGRIADFATYMTGELYAACRHHTILGRTMRDEPGANPETFRLGVKEGARPGSPGALLHRLFGVRTATLFNELSEVESADYLSGLLIGAELGDAASRFVPHPAADRPAHAVAVIGADGLAERYLVACEELGIEALRVDPDCTAAGHLAIARAAGLIG